MSLSARLSISKRRPSLTNSLEDEVAKELGGYGGDPVTLDAPVADVRSAADHVVEMTVGQCPSVAVTVFSDRAQCTRMVNVEVPSQGDTSSGSSQERENDSHHHQKRKK